MIDRFMKSETYFTIGAVLFILSIIGAIIYGIAAGVETDDYYSYTSRYIAQVEKTSVWPGVFGILGGGFGCFLVMAAISAVLNRLESIHAVLSHMANTKSQPVQPPKQPPKAKPNISKVDPVVGSYLNDKYMNRV